VAGFEEQYGMNEGKRKGPAASEPRPDTLPKESDVIIDAIRPERINE
jgi:hypothetical protein